MEKHNNEVIIATRVNIYRLKLHDFSEGIVPQMPDAEILVEDEFLYLSTNNQNAHLGNYGIVDFEVIIIISFTNINIRWLLNIAITNMRLKPNDIFLVNRVF